MATEIKVPTLGESVTEATVAKWFKKVGDTVKIDEPLVELETDKVTVEVPAPEAGTLSEIKVEEGEEVEVGAILGAIGEAGETAAKADESEDEKAESAGSEAEDETEPQPEAKEEDEGEKESAPEEDEDSAPLSPAVRRLIEENDLDPEKIPATGKDGRLTKEDVQTFLDEAKGDEADEDKAEDEKPKEEEPKKEEPKEEEPKEEEPEEKKAEAPKEPADDGAPREERVRMTRLRKRIAERLKEAQNTAAMLTTFNEVDMTRVMEVRNKYKETFEKKHGVRLGFMSFFAKACLVGLKEIPAVNAEIDGDELVYKNHYDLGIAVGTPQGLVVPVVRDADRKSFAEIELAINELGKKARDGKLSMEDLTGGTFTISNGGVYGSLMSTPILNPPQSGILGMHKTMMRPMVVGDRIEPRPMMYLALSYDHRIIDGREAVTFLVRVKECIEDPERILLDM